MKIGEVSKLTGLTASNIRFYEKKGLLEPEREQESDYRNYSQGDVERLKRIILYRKMNISVENIYLLLQEKISLQEVVERTLEELYEKQEMLKGSIELCEKALDAGNILAADVDKYLSYVKSEETKGTRYAEMEELMEEIGDFMQVNQFRGDPYVGKIFRNPWVARVIAAVLLAIYVIVPIVYVIETLEAGGKISVARLLIWLFLWAILLMRFVVYKKWRNK